MQTYHRVHRPIAVVSSVSSQRRQGLLSLRFAVTPNQNLDPNRRQVAPAGVEAVRSYVSYVIESLTALELKEPGSAAFLRSDLLLVWSLLNQHTPDLLRQFLSIEKTSRGADASGSLPTTSTAEKLQATTKND